MAEINWGLIDPNGPAKVGAAFYEGQQNQQKNAMAKYAMDKAAREDAAQNALAEAYRQSYDQNTGRVDDNALMRNMAQSGQGQAIPGIQKGIVERQKTEAETAAKQLEIASKRVNIAGQAFGYVRQNPTVDNALAAIDYLAQNGIYTPDQVVQYKQKVIADPGNVAKMADMAFRGALDAKAQLANIQTRNTGGTTDTIIVDPVTGAATVANSVKNTQSPESVASVAAQIRGQNMTDARARQSDMLSNGKAPAGYVWGPVGADGVPTMVAVKGGPADLKSQAIEQTKLAGASGVNSAIATLRDAYDKLESGGGITSTKKNAISNLAAAGSSSAIGQAIGRAVGSENQSARNTIAMTRPALLAAMMKATGMSAKQMDSNAELKLWMTTATDPTLDVEANRQALDKLEEKYLSGKQVSASPVQAGKAKFLGFE